MQICSKKATVALMASGDTNVCTGPIRQIRNNLFHGQKFELESEQYRVPPRFVRNVSIRQ